MKRPNTRQQILQLAEGLIRSKGYNSFSFHEIAAALGVKSAAVHYHFPTKEVLGLEVIRQNIKQFREFEDRVKEISLGEQLDEFIDIYTQNLIDNKVCLVGAICVEYYGLPDNMTTVMKGLAQVIHSWVSRLLAEGKAAGIFNFGQKPAQKATMLITNLAAGVQLARLMGPESFREMVEGIKTELYSAASTTENKL